MTAPTSERRTRNRLEAAAGRPLTAGSLVGSYFHADTARGWQGCVVAEPAPGVYLVELFEWIAGGSSEQRLLPIGEMSGWAFYDTADWMDNAYEHGKRRQWEAERAS